MHVPAEIRNVTTDLALVLHYDAAAKHGSIAPDTSADPDAAAKAGGIARVFTRSDDDVSPELRSVVGTVGKRGGGKQCEEQ